jgi:small subunit ribosomal protein S9
MEKKKESTQTDASATFAESMTKRKLSLKKDEQGTKQVRRQRKPTDQFVGRRKTAVARVSLRPGTGKILVNNRDINEYFTRADLRVAVMQPLLLTERAAQTDVHVNVYGGGVTGQAQAVALGIARSIDQSDSSQHSKLKAAGLLTRDPRMVERKKYGFHKARRATQFSKR